MNSWMELDPVFSVPIWQEAGVEHRRLLVGTRRRRVAEGFGPETGDLRWPRGNRGAGSDTSEPARRDLLPRLRWCACREDGTRRRLWRRLSRGDAGLLEYVRSSICRKSLQSYDRDRARDPRNSLISLISDDWHQVCIARSSNETTLGILPHENASTGGWSGRVAVGGTGERGDVVEYDSHADNGGRNPHHRAVRAPS